MEVAKFIDKTLKNFWKPNISKILRSIEYGYTAGEIIYKVKEDKIHFHAYKEFHPRDCVVLTRDHEYEGFRVKGMQGANHVDLFAPKGFWFAVNREFGGWYGRSYLINIWDSWFEKRSKDGAIDIRRLWFYKNAYHGGVIRYPHKDYVQPDGTIYSAREMAREQGERLKTGGIVVFPNARDADGRYQWEWDPPAIQGNATEIREYPRDLDVEISRGLGIPDSVLTDPSGTGSYAGRRVPERAFYVSLEQILSELINALKTQILDPLLKLNFEGEQEYEIITKPLVEVMSPEATPPAGYGQGVQGMPGNNSTTIGNVFSSGNDNPDMDMGLSNGSPVSAAAGGVAMSLRSNMAENFIHNNKRPLLGIILDNNKSIVAANKIRLSNNVEYNRGEYIQLKHIEQETQNAGFNNLEDAVSTISKFSNLDINTANTLFRCTAMSLRGNEHLLEEKTIRAGYGSVGEAWRDAQKISWLPSGLAYALYNKFGE